MRLGLLLAEIGDKNSIKVSRRGNPARDRRARAPDPRPRAGGLGLLPQEPAGVAGIRAPIYEEKVVDFLLELAKVTDKTVTKEELFKEDEDETAAGVM